ncbi:MAG: hypothetical protein H6740_12540 [Alphaproteobacteria bacterium]|nr:hypothetical protein [Alphaproteobacteria bacterium]
MLLLLLACAAPPEGLRLTPAGDGPVVRVDFDAEPLADIPYPNNMATRPDLTSLTGRRLNVETHTETRVEEEARHNINTMNGFGVYAPITVGFEGRIDIDDFQARHKDDGRYGAARLDDDAIYVIDVTPGSPTYLQAVEVDIGEGRFPVKAARSDRYFTNDARADNPSVVFDTTDEDLNGNGALDWGEDTDNDGRLDVPNVWPPGGDPVEDLLTWYELASDTIIMRPVQPMREGTTYAVVITERVIGLETGEPVRSPWEYVNHLSQTEDLAHVEAALDTWGLGVDDVAFAWTFTTATHTQDLVQIRRGRDGLGPFASLAEDYPLGIEWAALVHDLPTGEDRYVMPPAPMVEALVDLGLFEEADGGIIVDDYTHFVGGVVGGSFTTPYFLVDRQDDEDESDNDEYFRVNHFTGEMDVEEQRVAFTCVIPKETEEHHAPFPVAIYGHGYGSTRLEVLGFGHALARLGIATCSNDHPGHGPSINPDELALAEALLEARGLGEFLDHISDSRYRDLNNDGVPDSGGDQWSADAFHTRDMVRQAAVDWMWLIGSLQQCGQGEMELEDGGSRMSCDWNDDGTPDIGGADSEFYIFGGSLGGINAGVAAGVIPEVTAWAPIVPGAGLVDVGTRTEIGGAVEAMVGRMMSPLFVGIPDEAGGLEILQIVNTVTDMDSLHVAYIPDFPANGRLVLENLDKGIRREGMIPVDGRFRIGIPADALDGVEKAYALDMDALQGFEAAIPDDNALLGDRLQLTIESEAGEVLYVLDTFEEDVLHEGVTFPAGSTLVALNEGLGHIRATPEMHRVARAFAGILEPGDPAAYAPYYMTGHPDLADVGGGKPINVLVIPSIGDPIVNVATGIALARSAGFIERDQPDDRYGMSQDQFLIDRGVVQGLEQYGPYTNSSGASILFDPDDLDGGVNVYEEPSDTPLRVTVETESGISGMRLPYARPQGTHSFGLPEPDLEFDVSTFIVFQVSSWFASGGQVLSDDPCLEDASCPWIPAIPDQEQ